MTNPGWGGAASEGTPPPQPRCVRHPDRPTALACTRCGRPACPDCLRAASVGHQCVDCVVAGQRDARPARTVAGATVRTQVPTPLLTYFLIAANVAIFAVTAVQSRSVLDNHLSSPLFVDWVLWGPAVAAGEYGRIVTSGFLHIGLMHLAVNMFALYVIGRDIEIVLGRARYLAVYLISLLGGSASVLLLDPMVPTAGASGAIFGLLGAQAVILLRLRRSPTPVLAVIAINVIISLTIPGISLWGHMGGLVAGAVATAALLYAPSAVGAKEADRVRTAGWTALGAVGVLTLIATAAAVAAI
ncbi:rhomboid family intramembrane serine protease [Rhodococcus sp. ACT016]|uniref:rhomboid family intramembrane serine protease n=1 Tax=Rhodococcus sp. ACT016 TaxID=3134808 RepID=UPI003D2968A5